MSRMAWAVWPKSLEGNDAEGVWQQPLIDQPHRIARRVKGDGAEGPGAAANRDVHQAILTFIFRILSLMPR